VISSEEESKEIRVHQVVYGCLQKNITRDEIKKDIFNMLLAFSALDSCDLHKTSDIILTRPLVTHFVAISTKLKHFVELDPNAALENSIHTYTTDCILKIGRICFIHGNYNTSEIYLQYCLTIQQRIYDENDPTLATVFAN
jgi:hypothetical protein